MSNFKFNPNNWKIKVVNRNRDRMKLYIKLNAQEAEAFKNFADAVKPPEATLDDFLKGIFFAGIEKFEENLNSKIVEHIESNRDQYEASGFTFDEEGKFTGTEPEEKGTVETIE